MAKIAYKLGYSNLLLLDTRMYKTYLRKYSIMCIYRDRVCVESRISVGYLCSTKR